MGRNFSTSLVTVIPIVVSDELAYERERRETAGPDGGPGVLIDPHRRLSPNGHRDLEEGGSRGVRAVFPFAHKACEFALKPRPNVRQSRLHALWDHRQRP